MRQSFYDFCMAQGRPDLLRSWDAEKNAPLTPGDVSPGSHTRVLWSCPHGHTWPAAVYTRAGGRGCPYCAGRLPWPGENDLASRRPDLAREWDQARNAPLTPADVTAGSHRMVFWRCERGHGWRASVKSRAEGAGCPVCAGRRVAPGENDLAAACPDLARQWDRVRNAPLTPADVTPGSRRKVFWRCEKGHSWQAAVSARVRGCGCPVCAGRRVLPEENDLATRFPAIAAQWHPTKNGALTPAACAPSSNRRVWWRCEKGHDYQAAVSARTVHGSACPYCAGRKVLPGFNDLATRRPLIAAQWHPTMNGALTPRDVTAGSCRKVYWQCPEGHVWRAVVYSRTGRQQCGCPICAGRGRPPNTRP